jgi:hypothetical protein
MGHKKISFKPHQVFADTADRKGMAMMRILVKFLMLLWTTRPS